VDEEVEAAIIARLRERIASASIVLISDYLKGVITAGVMRFLREETRARRMALLVDPKIAHIGLYAGATLVTPNHHEAEAATARRIRGPEDARIVAREFRRRVGCDSVLVTWGEHGMWLLEGAAHSESRDSSDDNQPVVREEHLGAAAREVADVTGAGDTVIGTIALGLGAGASMREAAVLANQAAGIAVGHFGPAAVSAEELLEAIEQG
jgi:D-beta-D-heptose 7-phosphate kinase/D-beta-D-heptose 1-phosphate adenosyltransferase